MNSAECWANLCNQKEIGSKLEVKFFTHIRNGNPEARFYEIEISLPDVKGF